MTVALLLFALAAVLGLFLAVKAARREERPLPIVLAHGAAAAAGLVTLLVVVLRDAPALAAWALGGFGVAALGGFVLFGLDRTGRGLPLPVVAVHGVVAVAAFLVLLAATAGLG